MKKLICFIVTALLGVTELSAQVVNGNFESGRNAGWIEQSQGNFTLIGTGAFFASTEIQPPVNPRSGNWMGRIGGFSYEVNAIGQTITLPNTTPLYLSFFAQSRSSTTSECAGLWVGAKISIIVNNQVITSTYLCNYNDLHNWTQYFIDLSAIAGQSAQLVFKAEAANSVWSFMYIDDVSLTNSLSAVKDGIDISSFKLEQNYPNPFNPQTKISFTIPEVSFVTLKVFDVLGKEVAVLAAEELRAGSYNREFIASDLPSGIYYCQLRAGSLVKTMKMTLLK